MIKLPRHDIPKNNYRSNYTIFFCYPVVLFHVIGRKSVTADPYCQPTLVVAVGVVKNIFAICPDTKSGAQRLKSKLGKLLVQSPGQIGNDMM